MASGAQRLARAVGSQPRAAQSLLSTGTVFPNESFLLLATYKVKLINKHPWRGELSLIRVPAV